MVHNYRTTRSQRRNGSNVLFGVIDTLQGENRRLLREVRKLRRRISELEEELEERRIRAVEWVTENWQQEERYSRLITERNRLRGTELRTVIVLGVRGLFVVVGIKNFVEYSLRCHCFFFRVNVFFCIVVKYSCDLVVYFVEVSSFFGIPVYIDLVGRRVFLQGVLDQSLKKHLETYQKLLATFKLEALLMLSRVGFLLGFVRRCLWSKFVQNVRRGNRRVGLRNDEPWKKGCMVAELNGDSCSGLLFYS
ncbi:hypothetical protein C2G38_2029376 [Gigaspora rosea]|uniref:Uncharacterized protein n=1 Tax=Gigaspora rosea TaxID=44941 RepID=A0A397VY45_9GLOM|nr:hypothetical protein C2G38_2029376 [Gigaspora rosea]